MNKSKEKIFGNYVVGNSNKFAHAACLSVLGKSDQDFNPLFIYGPLGVGKTHLMRAMEHELVRRNPTLKVVYTTGKKISNDVARNLSNPKSRTMVKYYESDVLFVDNIHLIDKKRGVQKAVRKLLDDLIRDNKQIVLSSGLAVREMIEIDAKLKALFESGLIADIQAPDKELKKAILGEGK